MYEDHQEVGPSEIRSLVDRGSDAGIPEAGPIYEVHPEAENSEETPYGSEVTFFIVNFFISNLHVFLNIFYTVSNWIIFNSRTDNKLSISRVNIINNIPI